MKPQKNQTVESIYHFNFPNNRYQDITTIEQRVCEKTKTDHTDDLEDKSNLVS